ncbi:hypothetical protein DM47_1914 [Burkholderia mallei]|nr:hypothetical protein DM47_1914 [Burkholderia mallei]
MPVCWAWAAKESANIDAVNRLDAISEGRCIECSTRMSAAQRSERQAADTLRS